MSEALHPYYDRELAALRTQLAGFARQHPRVAARLRLGEDGAVDDPLVGRLLDGAAFLAARVQQRLDDEFPELTDALLGILYPHYLAPVPSAAIIQFTGVAALKGPLPIQAGRVLDSEPVGGESCRFRTTSSVTLWPLQVAAAQLSGQLQSGPLARPPERAQSLLRLVLTGLDEQTDLAGLDVATLRFFVQAPGGAARALHELLCGHAVLVALVAGAPGDAGVVELPPTVLTPAGFAPEDALLPWPARSFAGFRLLSEYFALPEKFLFVDLAGLRARPRPPGCTRLEVFVYFDRAAPELERSVTAATLSLGCTPVINLFEQACTPITLSQTRTEYLLEPNPRIRAADAVEIWQVLRVRERHEDGSYRDWQPFYRLQRPAETEAAASGFYAVTRRAAGSRPGFDVLLAPFDPDLDVAAAPSQGVLSVDALCTNRDLPSQLPFPAGRPALRLAEGLAAVGGIACLTAPSGCVWPPLRARAFWPLVSHLSLGHLSVVGGAAAAQALREVLLLYELRGDPTARQAIAALTAVTAEPGVARLPGSQRAAFCRGLEVTLEWDAKAWDGGGLYLLASVIERFLALHATVNSFVRTNCTLRGRPGPVARWPARAGAQVLL